jgi:Domain of unknown function (DUF1931)
VTPRETSTPAAGVGYGTAWLQAFLTRGSGLLFDAEQTAQVARLAERSLVSLFDVAEQTALANGRAVILRHDLPLTRGLQARLGEAEAMAADVELQPVLVFLAEAGVRGPLDERVRAEVPRLMAALLLLAGRVIAIVEPDDVTMAERLDRLLRRRQPSGPTPWELERASRVLGLTV